MSKKQEIYLSTLASGSFIVVAHREWKGFDGDIEKKGVLGSMKASTRRIFSFFCVILCFSW